MRHRLAQLLAASSREENPRAAACSPPSSSPGEAGREAEPHHEEAAEAFLEEPGHVDGNEELLFPAGLELDDWLEAAVAAEARPDWEASEDGAGGSPSRPAMSWLSQLPASRSSSSSSSSRRPSGGNSRMKAAAAARLNRQKKKQYVLGLESRLQGLAAENRQLRDRNRGLGRRLRELERETSYLRAVLANQSALGRILSHLAGGDRAGLRISCSSLFEDQRQPPPSRTPLEGRLSWESSSTSSSSSSDHDYALPAPEEEGEEEEEDKRAFPSSSPGGICLHVDWDQVSIEFCSACARRAASSALAAAPPAKIFSFRCLPCQAPLCRG